MLDIVYWKQIHLAFWKMKKKNDRRKTSGGDNQHHSAVDISRYLHYSTEDRLVFVWVRYWNHRKHMRSHFVSSFLSSLAFFVWAREKRREYIWFIHHILLYMGQKYIHQYIMQIVKMLSDMSSLKRESHMRLFQPYATFVYIILFEFQRAKRMNEWNRRSFLEFHLNFYAKKMWEAK